MTVRYLVLGLCLLSAACGQKAEEGKATAAGGEVLPGSISDSMIDLDTSTAAPPLAPVRTEAKAKAVTESSTPAPDASEAPQPAAPADSAPAQ